MLVHPEFVVCCLFLFLFMFIFNFQFSIVSSSIVRNVMYLEERARNHEHAL